MGRRWAVVALGCGAAVVVAMGLLRERPAPARGVSGGDPDRGRHLVDHVLACGACHGPDLGGATTVDGRWAPNLTGGPGGVGPRYDASGWEVALRQGRGAGGGAVHGMSAERWVALSPADLADAVAWLERLPVVERVPPSEPGSPRPEAPAPAVVPSPGPAPARAPDVAYGRYLAAVAGCDDCHGHELRGGRLPGVPVPAPDLSPEALADWTGADFARAVVGGLGRDGRPLHPAMPSRAYAGLHDTELDALWQFVRHGADGVVGSADE